MPNTIRAFVALNLPPGVIDLAAGLQSALKERGLRLRWVRPQSIHLTLKFLGDISPGDAGAIGEAIQRAGRGMAPLQLTVQGMGVFPGIKRPRVLWIGLGGQIEPLRLLYARVEDELADLGVAREQRGFKAHLTLARFKQGGRASEVLEAIASLGTYESKSFAADRLVLYKSDLRPQGAVYTPLTEVPLAVHPA